MGKCQVIIYLKGISQCDQESSRLSQDPFTEPWDQSSFNNTKMSFAFALSLSHRCTEEFSRTYVTYEDKITLTANKKSTSVFHI